MWYWNSELCTEALKDVHDLTECIEIEDDEHLFKTQPTPFGKIWRSDKNGMPALVDIPPLTHEEQVAAVEAKRITLIAQANDYINTKQWPSKLALGRLTDDDKIEFNKWLDYIDALEEMDTSNAQDIEWPLKPVN